MVPYHLPCIYKYPDTMKFIIQIYSVYKSVYNSVLNQIQSVI